MGIRTLDETMSSLLRTLNQDAESGFEVSFGGGETRNCFPMILSYCCDTPKAKDMSAVRQGAGRQLLCVRSHGT